MPSTIRPTLFPAILVGIALLAALTLGRTLLPFILGLLLALIFAPVHQSVRQSGLGPGTAAAGVAILANIATFAVIAAIAWFLVLIAQTLMANLPELWGRLLNRGAELAPSDRVLSGMSREPPSFLTDPLASLGGQGGSLALTLVSITGSTVTLALLVTLTPFVTFYLLRDGRALLDRIVAVVSDQKVAETENFLRLAKQRLFAALGGQLLISGIQTAIYAAGYLMIGLNWALALAILSGFARLVPILGGLVTFGVAFMAALLQFDHWLPLAGVAAVHLFVEVLEITFLVPVMIGARACIHPLLVIATVLVGSALFGILGLLVSIPLAAALGALLEALMPPQGTADPPSSQHPEA